MLLGELLANAVRLVEMQPVVAVSDAGRGCTVSVRLPVDAV
jgi:hypothetical protein